jgi:hypothetical protein
MKTPKYSSLSLLLWITAISISFLFSALPANAQLKGDTPTLALDPEVLSMRDLAQGVTYLDVVTLPQNRAIES